LLARRHQYPLPLLTVAGDVHLERMRIVVLAVAAHDASRMVQVLDVVTEAREVGRTEESRSGRVDAGADGEAGVDGVLVGEDVGRAGLRIAQRRHAISEIGEIRPRLLVLAMLDVRMGMSIHETRDE